MFIFFMKTQISRNQCNQNLHVDCKRVGWVSLKRVFDYACMYKMLDGLYTHNKAMCFCFKCLALNVSTYMCYKY